MIRFQKRLAIFFYTIFMIGVIIYLIEVIHGAPVLEAVLPNMILLIFCIPAVHIHKSYKRQIEMYTNLLKESKVDRIEYMIDHIDTVRGRIYNTIFYIGDEKCRLRISQFECKNNNNYEYYLKPIYKKNGEFKDFIAYADKRESDKKCIHSTNELREYEEKISLLHEQKDK